MIETGNTTTASGAGAGYFATTRWTVVLTAAPNDTPEAREALAELCQTYWYPLYAYVRRRGYSPPDAEDMTQEFFARLLEHNWLVRADQAKGRFRTFLLTSMERFLANEWDKVRAQKRGGGCRVLSLNMAEIRYGAELADTNTPEQAFDRRWAMTLLQTVLLRLEVEFSEQGKATMFALLRPCLVGPQEALPYQQLAEQLGLTEANLKVTVHRLRHRYRELLRAEIAHTVASADEVDLEMRHLFNILTNQ